MEEVIVTLTTWTKRIAGIRSTLDSILAQSVRPDRVVVNLSFDEVIPEDIDVFFQSHGIEVCRVEDTKVYKKLIPTLKRYPDACVICVDDDWIYPKDMIKEFLSIHAKYPDFPISGNRVSCFGMKCHCGCASLTKASFLSEGLKLIDSDLISNCPADDIVYTYFSLKSGHPYIQTDNEFFLNMESTNADYSYSDGLSGGIIVDTYKYLVHRFGGIDGLFSSYCKNDYFASLMTSIYENDVKFQWQLAYMEFKKSSSFRLGNSLISPLVRLKKILKKD